MKNKLRLFSTLVLILAFPLAAAANVDVSPTSEVLGDVELGSSADAVITIQNTDFLFPATITSITLDSSAAFEISSIPADMEILPGQSVDVVVTFTPNELGDASAVLHIDWENSGPGFADVTISGTGVDSSSNSPTVSDILAFFDQSVANGSLVGDGPGSSADGRRGALRNKIKAAGDMLEAGDDACEQLLDAYQRTDGLPRPPDFVTGTAAGTLAQMILDMMGDLGCE